MDRLQTKLSHKIKLASQLSVVAALATAAMFAAMYFFTAFPRIFYPYDLDFIENGILMGAARFVRGQSLYIAPQAEFTPHVYMPLYTWLGGLLFRLFGVGYVPLRGLSFLAVMVSTGLIFFVGKRESKQVWAGLLCAGLFLGGYRITGFWYELARVDSLFVVLSVAGLAAGSYSSKNRRELILAAGLMALAFLTKQTAIIFGVGLALYLAIIWKRHSLWYAIPFIFLTSIPALILNFGSEGWFFYYVFGIAGINPIELSRLANFVGYELLIVMGGLSIMAVITVVLCYKQSGFAGVWQQPWFIWIGLAIIISAMGRASVGGNLNNRMAAYTLLCLAPALLIGQLEALPVRIRHKLTVAIASLVLLQFAMGVYNPLRYIPTQDMRATGDQFIETIATTEGEVLVLMHPYYAVLAGKAPSAQIAAMWHARQRGVLPLPPDFEARLKNRHYNLIVSDDSIFERDAAFQALLNKHYSIDATASSRIYDDLAPPTNTGMVVQPHIIYRPKPQ